MKWQTIHALIVAFLLVCNLTSASNCKVDVSNCQCDNLEGGNELWCPTRINHDFRILFRTGQLLIECDSGKGLTTTDLLLKARDITIGKEMEVMKLVSCPILKESYQRLVDYTNITKLDKLMLHYSGEESEPELVANQFQGMDYLVSLDLTQLGLERIDKDAFVGLSNLKSLTLIGSTLKTFPANTFQPLLGLLHLKIALTKVEELPRALFQNQHNIKHLTISTKSVKRYPEDLLRNLTKLETLFFDKVSLDPTFKVPSNFFKDLTSLVQLNVSGRGLLETAPDNLFQTTKLAKLHWGGVRCFDRNGCPFEVTSSFVKNLEHLSHFDFTANLKINYSLPSDFFEGCKNLEEINLSNSGLQSLSDGFCADCKKLKKMILNKNALKIVESRSLRGLTELQHLDLSGNQITELRDNDLEDLRSLKILSLADNQIANIENDAFFPLSSLEMLDISDNKLDIDSHLNWRSLTNLKSLDLSKNSISWSRVPSAWNSILLSLRYINVSHNVIGPKLDVIDLNFHQKRLKVNLSFNNISYIDFSGSKHLHKPPAGPEEEDDDDSDGKSKSPRIILSGNPFHCDCNALDFARFLRGDFENEYVQSWFHVIGVDRKGTNMPKCQDPVENAGLLLHTMSLDNLYCTFPSSDMDGLDDIPCPDYCVCRVIPSSRTTVIDCHDKNLTTFPDFLPMVPDSDSVALNMCDNNVSDISAVKSQVKNFTAISKLDLCHNNIKTVKGQDLPPNLELLNLEGNHIDFIDMAALEFFKKMGKASIHLGNNSFPCDCPTKHLLNFVRSYSSKIGDLQNITITCNNVTKRMVEWKPHEICPVIWPYVLPVIFTFIILALIMVILCLFNKDRVHIWVYSHPKLRYLFCIADTPDGPNMKDAFISYSIEDKDFVENKLIYELENGKDLRYKCINHVRDFNLGQSIVQQISDAVDNSQRTIIVLSKNFVTSEWFQREFEAANEKKKVIVIVYGELPSKEEMGPQMWQYIKTNTYLSHDDPQFWQKLHYALPHRGRKVSRRGSRKTTDEMKLIEQGLGKGKANPNFEGTTNTVFVPDPPSNHEETERTTESVKIEVPA